MKIVNRKEPKVEEVIDRIRKTIDEDQRSLVRFIYVETLIDILYLLKEHEPHEITKDEWESWKKDKHRDPLCMYWRGDITPLWILRPEEVHEPAYLIGDIKIFKGKPDKEKMYKIWEQDNGKQNAN